MTTNFDALFSSESGDWETPDEVFAGLSDEFKGFGYDAAASHANRLCTVYSTPEGTFRREGAEAPQLIYPVGGLGVNWGRVARDDAGGQAVWCNPPYGRGAGQWVRAAVESAGVVPIVLLLPARTDVMWFHNWLYKKPGVELRFFRGRLCFGRMCPGCSGRGTVEGSSMPCLKCGGAKRVTDEPAPFPSMLAVLRP